MLNTHDEKKNQMRRGFKNAELGETPGGAESEMAAKSARVGGTAASAEAPTAVSRSARDGVAVVVMTASAGAVSQPGVAIACTIDVAGVEAAESEAP